MFGVAICLKNSDTIDLVVNFQLFSDVLKAYVAIILDLQK